jgi:hypothetical protein
MKLYFSNLMYQFSLAVLLFFYSSSFAGDSTTVTHDSKLRGYKKLFYKIVSLHPKLNSPVEKALLKHYLAGSGKPFLFSDSDFKRLVTSVAQSDTSNERVSINGIYFVKKITLDDDAYFGWGLGTIQAIYDNTTSQMVSFTDVYDFNKKKKGKRKLKSEMVTRIFRLIAPRSSKSFIVSYGENAYITASL